ncbi:MAG: hypothetical protein BGN97_00375 [Microbacterium sp. 69-10]|uniref:hypothetical protein n=1 Tax=Microbacterium sp. 69-10 TaxID=1895783 RepID=UPI000962D792|nr:hypothetical protein [Microbacterium sp. 69-10]OJU39710.1 MAG: hypothetical protein BGN97_00375 [Microbacterium sp. 69-10]
MSVEMLPTVPGFTSGVVGIAPYRLQCAGCGSIETPEYLILMRTKFYGFRHGDLRRLCEACATAAGYEVTE